MFVFSIMSSPLQYPASKMVLDQFCLSCIPFVKTLCFPFSLSGSFSLHLFSIFISLLPYLLFYSSLFWFSASFLLSFTTFTFLLLLSMQLRSNLKKQSQLGSFGFILCLFHTMECISFDQFSSKRSGLLSDSDTYLTHIFYSPAQRNVTFLLHWDLF